MSQEYGDDFITITDEDGVEYELEVLDELEYRGNTYLALISAMDDSAEDDADTGLILLKSVEENGEEILSTLDDDEEIDAVYQLFMERMGDEEDEEAPEDPGED